MSKPNQVLLTPLAISDDRGHFICIAIRDPETEEIVETVITSHDLAEKTGMSLEKARRIFQAAQQAADQRLQD